MGEFPSGQRGQTVNLLSTTSVVRIHLPPPTKKASILRNRSFFRTFLRFLLSGGMGAGEVRGKRGADKLRGQADIISACFARRRGAKTRFDPLLTHTGNSSGKGRKRSGRKSDGK